tara:strand:+ start:2260 stop:2688 length:429 start_codon:yes stop_codon:yes gene_type:complete
MNIEKIIKEEIMRILLENVDDGAIRKALEAEGGAAGLEAIANRVNATSDEALAAMEEMDDVGKHKDGDYILADGENIRVVTSVEEKKRKKKKKKKKKSSGKKDACYYKVKARYSVWPSAYASGALVKCRRVGAKNWGNKSKK